MRQYPDGRGRWSKQQREPSCTGKKQEKQREAAGEVEVAAEWQVGRVTGKRKEEGERPQGELQSKTEVDPRVLPAANSEADRRTGEEDGADEADDEEFTAGQRAA